METKPAKIQEGIVPFSFFNNNQFETIQRVALMFASSELVPEMYQIAHVGKDKAISNSIIAIEMANRIGASPLMIMQNMVIIYGRPSWSSKFLIATVNTCGRFNSLKFKFDVIGVLKDYKYTEYETEWITGANGQKKKTTKVVEKMLSGQVQNIRCIAYTSEKGSTEILESAPVTIEMAINEGWYTKKGSKWQSMTQQMLMYRTASFWTNAYAPELSMGMKTEDEIIDITDVDFEEIAKPNREVKHEIIPQPEPIMDTEQDQQRPAPEQKTLKLEDM